MKVGAVGAGAGSAFSKVGAGGVGVGAGAGLGAGAGYLATSAFAACYYLLSLIVVSVYSTSLVYELALSSIVSSFSYPDWLPLFVYYCSSVPFDATSSAAVSAAASSVELSSSSELFINSASS